jgi:hypothetical protein
MPYPAGIIAALLTVMSDVAHTPSIGFDPPKKRGANLLPSKFSHDLFHGQSFDVRERLSYRFPVDVLVGVKAHYQLVSF